MTRYRGGKGKKSTIEERVAQLKKQRDTIDAKYDKEKLDERIAKLSGGWRSSASARHRAR